MNAPPVGGRPASHHHIVHGDTDDDGNIPSAPEDGVGLSPRMPPTQATPRARPRVPGADYKFLISTGANASAGSKLNTRA